MTNVMTNVITIISTCVSLVTLYFVKSTYFSNKPKVIIEQIKLALPLERSIINGDDGNVYYSFVLKISNPKNVGIEINSISIPLKKGTLVKQICVMVKPYSSIQIYVGNWGIAYFKLSREQESKNNKILNKRLQELGVAANTISGNNNYFISCGLFVPKDDRPKKTTNPNELIIEIGTVYKKHTITLDFNQSEPKRKFLKMYKLKTKILTYIHS